MTFPVSINPFTGKPWEDRITFFSVRTYEDGTGLVINCPMQMCDIVYLLNSPRDEESREKYFVNEAEALAYLKKWEAKWEASQ